MDAGQTTVEWLYTHALHVTPEWSKRTERGFTWWADKNAQAIEIMGVVNYTDGHVEYLIAAQTNFLRRVELTDEVLQTLNFSMFDYTSMAGLVYEEEVGHLRYCSLVKVREETHPWLDRLIGFSAALQIAESRVLAAQLGEVIGAQPNVVGPLERGTRPEPDPVAEIIHDLIIPAGRRPCLWPKEEFAAIVVKYGELYPSLHVRPGGNGFITWFPYGDRTSYCEVTGTHQHPWYGNGLAFLQSFEVKGLSDVAGSRLALALNARELSVEPSGYGFGSYSYRLGMVLFTTFIPNAAYQPGFLPNLFVSAVWRADEMNALLVGADFAGEPFDLRRGARGQLAQGLWGIR